MQLCNNQGEPKCKFRIAKNALAKNSKNLHLYVLVKIIIYLSNIGKYIKICEFIKKQSKTVFLGF